MVSRRILLHFAKATLKLGLNEKEVTIDYIVIRFLSDVLYLEAISSPLLFIFLTTLCFTLYFTYLNNINGQIHWVL